MEKLTNEELDKEIKKEQEKNLRPNYYCADLLKEKIKRIGYEVRDTKEGQRAIKL